LDGKEDDFIDTSQCTAQVEHCQGIEVTEPQGDFPTCHDGESRTLSISIGAPVQYGAERKRERIVKRSMEQWPLRTIPLLTGKGNGLRMSYDVAQSEKKR
jgi:hypothetical protein